MTDWFAGAWLKAMDALRAIITMLREAGNKCKN